MNRIAFTLILTFFAWIDISGINYNCRVQGRVSDKITGSPIPAKIFLMTPDSVIVDTTTAVVENFPYQGMISMYVFNKKINQRGVYIVKAIMRDYKDCYTNFEIKSVRQNNISVKPLLMEHDYHEIPEIMVKATKIKMVMRGDTIEYNADAFNLAEGSMLDALISRLPGAELTKEGKILINGKYVQSLLLNGRDFFNGNPKMALENLPLYTVNKIKVYEREGETSSIMQRNMGDQNLVMDVRLKKEYDATIFGNLEAGLGTKERFALKGFGMKTSQKEMLFAFTNINNLNDNQKADMSGRWTTQDTPEGLLTKRIANVSYARFFDSSMDKWFSIQNTLSHDNCAFETLKNTEIFLPEGNLHKRLQGGTKTGTTLFDSQNSFKYAENGKYSTMSSLNFHYKRIEKSGYTHTSSSNEMSLLNRLMEDNMENSENYHLTFSNSDYLRNIVDLLHVDINVDYDKLNGHTFSLYDLRYVNMEMARDFRNNYLMHDSRNWNIKSGTAYDWNWPGWSLRPQYQYNYKYNKTNHLLYRLDKLEQRDSTRYDFLPSSRTVLFSVLDHRNSYEYTEYQNHHRVMLEWDINAASGPNKLNINYGYIRLPLRMVSKNLYYMRMGRHDVSTDAVFFEPELFFRGGRRVQWEISAALKSEIPDLVNMVDYQDDSNPLYIISGNPDLKNIHRYHVSVSMQHKGAKQQLWHTSLEFNGTDNDVAYATLYNTSTGIATIKPVSVNGNWRTKGFFDYSMALDSARRWIFDNHFSAEYYHNVDMTTTEKNATSMRSVVNNWMLGDVIKINFRPNVKLEFTFHASGTYYYINSRRNDFRTIHAGNYKIGIDTDLQLPWRFNFGSDFSLYARRGYQESMMNTTEWVWNTRLQRSFLKGALLAKLTGFDLLHQLSNTRYEMNEQGRTEIWYNSLPRYVMFSLTWKFNASHRKE